MEPIEKALQGNVGKLHGTPKDRIRLIRLLRNKFGRGYRMFPDAKDALKHFDKERKSIQDFVKFKGEE